MTLTITPGFTLPLGSTPDGSPVALDLTNNPHTLLVGPTGSGKAVFLRHLANSCMAAGAKAVVIDPIRCGFDFRKLHADVVATTSAEASSELEGIVSEIRRRLDLLAAFNVSKWQELPEEARKAEAVQPIVVLIDEYASIVHPRPVPKGIDPDDDCYREVQEHNAEAERMLSSVRSIVHTARSCGIHLVLITQRPDVNVVPPSVREHLDNVIMMLRPGFLPSETAVAVAFRPEHREAAMAAIHEEEGKAAYGDAVIASTTAGVQRLNVPYND